MRSSVMVGVLGLGALLVSFALVFFLWGPATATSVSTPATTTAAASAPKATPANLAPAGRAASSPSGFADTTGSIGSMPPARQPVAVAAAPACQNPDALGISRTVEIDTTDGPGFGLETFKQHDFLQPGEVVLTFDDGPWPHNTPAVLAALAANCTKALFFAIGEHSMWAPEILRQVAAAGHTIGSHTWSHKDLAKLSVQDGKDEIEKGISAVRWALGVPPAPFFRFPALSHAPEMVTYLGERNIGIFSTDMDSLDFKIHKPDQVIASVMAKLKKNGKGIVLMHDFQRATAEAAPELLRQLKVNGYKVVFVKAKMKLSTIAAYDDMIVKNVKLPTLSEHPTSSVVRTIPD
ncbi:MAG TPA: polysaccharide deacetylase family protein [Xanthobacteraceae bacterium]|nr:polysaccharide deacetylase family protein [Xanthobacteraceae bacterium]